MNRPGLPEAVWFKPCGHGRLIQHGVVLFPSFSQIALAMSEWGMSVVLFSHDGELIARMADTIMNLESRGLMTEESASCSG